jgi:hypothetical protein
LGRTPGSSDTFLAVIMALSFNSFSFDWINSFTRKMPRRSKVTKTIKNVKIVIFQWIGILPRFIFNALNRQYKKSFLLYCSNPN